MFEERNEASTSSLPETPPSFLILPKVSGQAVSAEGLRGASVSGGFLDEVLGLAHLTPALTKRLPLPAFPPVPSWAPPPRVPCPWLSPPSRIRSHPTVFTPGLCPELCSVHTLGVGLKDHSEPGVLGTWGSDEIHNGPLWTPCVALSGRRLAFAPVARLRPSGLEGLRWPLPSRALFTAGNGFSLIE